MFPDMILPIAQIEISPLIVLALGSLGGFVSSFLGIGSGIVVTPALMFVGIPPIVAVASQLHNSVGTNFIGFLGYWRRRNVDFALAWYIFVGGVGGALSEIFLLRIYKGSENLYYQLAIAYVFILGFLGSLMLLQNIHFAVNPKPKHKNVMMREWMIYVPIHRIFTRSRVEMSILIPIGVGYLTGLFTSTLGGGNSLFIMPIVSYLIGRSSPVVAGTSLLAGAAISIVVVILHASTNSVGDIFLVYLLILGSFAGSQLALRFRYFFSQNALGMLGGVVVCLIAAQFAYDVFFAQATQTKHLGLARSVDYATFGYYAQTLAALAAERPMVYGLLGLLSIILTAYILERLTRFVWYVIAIKKWGRA